MNTISLSLAMRYIVIWQLFGNRHVPFASVSERAADISITFAAPTKTFNMAGIVSSYAVISNDDFVNASMDG